MFDVLMDLTVILCFGFPAVPWFFGARWGRRGIWLGTGLVVVILFFFRYCFRLLALLRTAGKGR
jgi:hypothetical protein